MPKCAWRKQGSRLARIVPAQRGNKSLFASFSSEKEEESSFSEEKEAKRRLLLALSLRDLPP
jgi:hypothetical protein